MTNVTTLDQLTIVKALAKPTAMGLVIAANPHLTKLQVETIAADNGHPKIAALRDAMDRLQRQVDDERMAATVHTGPTEADLAAAHQARVNRINVTPDPPPTQPAPRPAPVAPGPQPHEPTAQLLLEARDSTSKRTVALARKIEDHLVQLRDQLAVERQAKREKALAEARKAREAQEREQQRQDALAEVARAEAALKAAREKARRFKHTPGGNGRAKVLRAQTAQSKRPGGLAVREHLTDYRDAGRQYQYDLVDRLGCTIADIRAWANTEGLNPGKGSRIARSILDAYEAAHTDQAAS